MMDLKNVSREMKEAYLVASLYKNSTLLRSYDEEKLHAKLFEIKAWQFFYYVARKLANRGVIDIDEVAVTQYVYENGHEAILAKYNEFGGWQTISDVMEILPSNQSINANFDAYYSELKKDFSLKDLAKFFGEIVYNETDRYSPKDMNSEELYAYWIDKLNRSAIANSTSSGFEESNLLDGLEEYIKDLMENPEIGLPIRFMPRLNRTLAGWLQGKMYFAGSFSNGGKSSIMFKTLIMSCIENKEKIVVIANEEGEKAFKEKLFVNIMGENGIAIDRFKFKSGDFNDEDMTKIRKAMAIINELVGDSDTNLVKFIFLESFTEASVENVMRHYSVRGYNYFLIDTLKVPDGAGGDARWARLSEFTKRIYRLTRAEAGGLNVCTVLTIQLRLANARQRFLTMDSIAEGKQVVNEADAFICWRDAYPDEYEGETNEVTFIHREHDPLNPLADNNGWVEEKKKLDTNKHYVFMFIPKNRMGGNTSNTREVIVLEVNWKFGSIREVGITKTILFE